MTKNPAAFVQHHARRRAQRDREVASQYPAGPAPEPPPAPPPAPRHEPERRTVVTVTRSGARLETHLHLEQRSDLVPVAYDRHSRAREWLRWQEANARMNRRCRHLGQS